MLLVAVAMSGTVTVLATVVAAVAGRSWPRRCPGDQEAEEAFAIGQRTIATEAAAMTDALAAQTKQAALGVIGQGAADQDARCRRRRALFKFRDAMVAAAWQGRRGGAAHPPRERAEEIEAAKVQMAQAQEARNLAITQQWERDKPMLAQLAAAWLEVGAAVAKSTGSSFDQRRRDIEKTFALEVAKLDDTEAARARRVLRRAQSPARRRHGAGRLAVGQREGQIAPGPRRDGGGAS